MTDGVHDLMLDLTAWTDAETGGTFNVVSTEDRHGIVDSTFEFAVDDEPLGSLVLEQVAEPPTLVIRSADLGPLAQQGVASRFYDWALPIVREAGIERLTCNPRQGEELLRSKGWVDNDMDGLGTLMLRLDAD